jgi:hypothetical protein
LQVKQSFFEVHKKARRSVGIELTQGTIDENTQTCSWQMKLFGQEDVRTIEELLIKKKDWAGCSFFSVISTLLSSEIIQFYP